MRKLEPKRSVVADCYWLRLLIVEIIKNGYSMLLLVELNCGEDHDTFMEAPPSCFHLPFHVYISFVGGCCLVKEKT